MSPTEISCIGETCITEHIVKFRNAYNKAKPGEIFILVGDNELGKKEILKAAEFMGVEIVEIKDINNQWTIKFRKG